MKLYYIFIVFFALGYFLGYFFNPYCKISYYNEIIEEQSQLFALDNQLVRAVIMTESGGDVKAVSHKGAKGLMQLLPDTAKELAKKLKISENKTNLYDPQINIKLGCYYLYQLMVKFNGDLVLVLAAYNTGPYRVEKWLRNYYKMSSQEMVDTMASQETRDFVRRVLFRYKQSLR